MSPQQPAAATASAGAASCLPACVEWMIEAMEWLARGQSIEISFLGFRSPVGKAKDDTHAPLGLGLLSIINR
jgi:hypothetical protein